jgi:hypothetical protein
MAQAVGYQLGSPVDIRGGYGVDIRIGQNGTFWNDLTTALANIPSTTRFKGLTVNVLSSGKIVEYWFRDGIADINLIKKGGSGASVLYAQNLQIEANSLVLIVDSANNYYTYFAPTAFTTNNTETTVQDSEVIDTNNGNLIYQAGYKDTFVANNYYFKDLILYNNYGTYKCINSYSNTGTTLIADANNWELMLPEFENIYQVPELSADANGITLNGNVLHTEITAFTVNNTTINGVKVTGKLDGVNPIQLVQVGMYVTGINIAGGTTITSISTPDSNGLATITLNNVTKGSGSFIFINYWNNNILKRIGNEGWVTNGVDYRYECVINNTWKRISFNALMPLAEGMTTKTLVSGVEVYLLTTANQKIINYYEGLQLTLTFDAANTTTLPKINLNGIGNVNLKDVQGNGLSVNSINISETAIIVYVGGVFRLISGGTSAPKTPPTAAITNTSTPIPTTSSITVQFTTSPSSLTIQDQSGNSFNASTDAGKTLIANTITVNSPTGITPTLSNIVSYDASTKILTLDFREPSTGHLKPATTYSFSISYQDSLATTGSSVPLSVTTQAQTVTISNTPTAFNQLVINEPSYTVGATHVILCEPTAPINGYNSFLIISSFGGSNANYLNIIETNTYTLIGQLVVGKFNSGNPNVLKKLVFDNDTNTLYVDSGSQSSRGSITNYTKSGITRFTIQAGTGSSLAFNNSQNYATGSYETSDFLIINSSANEQILDLQLETSGTNKYIYVLTQTVPNTTNTIRKYLINPTTFSSSLQITTTPYPITITEGTDMSGDAFRGFISLQIIKTTTAHSLILGGSGYRYNLNTNAITTQYTSGSYFAPLSVIYNDNKQFLIESVFSNGTANDFPILFINSFDGTLAEMIIDLIPMLPATGSFNPKDTGGNPKYFTSSQFIAINKAFTYLYCFSSASGTNNLYVFAIS